MRSIYLSALAAVALFAVASSAVACDAYGGGGATTFSFTQGYAQQFVQPVYAQQFAVQQFAYAQPFVQRQVIVGGYNQRFVNRGFYGAPFRQRAFIGGYGGGLRIRAPFVGIGW